MALKDFSITFQKIKTSTDKKDVSIVTGFNAIAQYIEHICKTQKGELPDNMNLGSDYFNYIFDGHADLGIMEIKLAADILAMIPGLNDVKVNVITFTDNILVFEVYYSFNDGINKQQKSSCFIEVEL